MFALIGEFGRVDQYPLGFVVTGLGMQQPQGLSHLRNCRNSEIGDLLLIHHAIQQFWFVQRTS